MSRLGLCSSALTLGAILIFSRYLSHYRITIRRMHEPNPLLHNFTRNRDVENSLYNCPDCSWNRYLPNDQFTSFESLDLVNDELIPIDFPPLLCLPETFGYTEEDAEKLFPHTVFNQCDWEMKDKRQFLHLDIQRNQLWMNCSDQQIAGKPEFMGVYTLDKGKEQETLGKRKYKEPIVDYTGVKELVNHEEFVYGSCIQDKTDHFEQAVYRNRVNPIAANRASTFPRKTKPLVIVVLTLDSVSRRNFYRKMPKTVDFLKNLDSCFRVFDFKLSNVMGEYSADNILPMLYGDIPVKMKKSIPDEDIFYNSSIYKMAKEHGFVTNFMEDDCGDDLARYLGKKIEVDHLGSFFWCAAAKFEDYVNNAPRQRCIGQKNSHAHAYQYVLDLQDNYPGLSQFSFLHMNTAHEPSGLLIETLDDDTEEFLTQLLLQNDSNEYAIFLNGDHGMRYGDWFKKLDGSKEHRLPLLHLILSDSLLQRVPFSYDTLTHNSKRLVSKLDLYTTLQHLIMQTQVSILKHEKMYEGNDTIRT